MKQKAFGQVSEAVAFKGFLSSEVATAVQKAPQAAEQTKNSCIELKHAAVGQAVCSLHHSRAQPKSSFLDRIPIYAACESGEGRKLCRMGQNAIFLGGR